jgi:hypothetical protein
MLFGDLVAVNLGRLGAREHQGQVGVDDDMEGVGVDLDVDDFAGVAFTDGQDLGVPRLRLWRPPGRTGWRATGAAY